MKQEEYKKITMISFPNTATGDMQEFYRTAEGFTFECIVESGEMSGIAWIGVFKDGTKVAQIKQSICNLYF